MRVMGILNATPDSFWAGSRYRADEAVTRGLSLVEEGAAVLDVGTSANKNDVTAAAPR